MSTSEEYIHNSIDNAAKNANLVIQHGENSISISPYQRILNNLNTLENSQIVLKYRIPFQDDIEDPIQYKKLVEEHSPYPEAFKLQETYQNGHYVKFTLTLTDIYKEFLEDQVTRGELSPAAKFDVYKDKPGFEQYQEPKPNKTNINNYNIESNNEYTIEIDELIEIQTDTVYTKENSHRVDSKNNFEGQKKTESEKELLQQFMDKHSDYLNRAQSKFFVGWFRHTKTGGIDSLKGVIEHAQLKNNRSRQVCQDLGWMKPDGTIKDSAPEVIKNLDSNPSYDQDRVISSIA